MKEIKSNKLTIEEIYEILKRIPDHTESKNRAKELLLDYSIGKQKRKTESPV